MSHPSTQAHRWADLRAIAIERHGVVSIAEAAGCGCSRSALARAVERGELVRLAPRTLAVAGLVDDRSHLSAACLSELGAVASHRSAAVLFGLDGVDADVVEVTTRGDRRSRHGRTHRSIDLLEGDVTVVDAVPTTDATRTCCDLGKVVGDDIVERAVESALRLGLTSLPRLRSRAERLARPGRSGPASLRRVLERRGRRAATESDLETLALQCLRSAGVPDPVVQLVVRHGGRSVARVDLAWPDELVYGELDGRSHHEAWADTVRDRRRQNALTLAGWMPLRFTWRDVVHDGPATAATVLETLRRRARSVS